jgi:hypothetical protein
MNIVENDEMLARKIEVLLEMQSKRMMTELLGMKEQIVTLTNEVTELKKAAARGRMNAAPSQVVQPAAQVAASSHAQAAAPVAHAPQQAAEPIDRNGIAPADVAIDKIFYFGQK